MTTRWCSSRTGSGRGKGIRTPNTLLFLPTLNNHGSFNSEDYCATSQTFMNPDNDNNLRRALLGCQSKGVGTVNEGEMVVHQVSLG